MTSALLTPLAGLFVRQDSGSQVRELLTTSLNLPAGCLTISPGGSFPSNPVQCSFHIQRLARLLLRIREMMTASDAFSLIRPKLVAIVAAEKRACGSACRAVEATARRIGATKGWVRRIIGRYDEAVLHYHICENIKAAYARIEARVERRAVKVSDLVARMKHRRAGASA